MKFNIKDYKGNIAYCEYVFNNIDGLELGLKTPAEVQYVANKYADRVNEIRGYASDELYEDDAMLLEIAQKAIRKFESLKKGFKTIEVADAKEDKIEAQKEAERMYEYRQSLIDEEIDRKLAYEKYASKRGGRNFDDSYDDHALDEIVEEEIIRR